MTWGRIEETTPLLPESIDWIGLNQMPGVQFLAEYRITTALLFIVIGWLLARLGRMIFRRITRTLAARTQTAVDDKVFELVEHPIYSTLFLGGLALAIAALELPEDATDISLKVLGSMLVVAWLRALFPVFSLLLTALSRNRHRFMLVEARTLPLFDMLGKIFLIAFGSYGLLLIWGIDVTAWLASAGIVGVALGFAAKDTLANLFSGFFIVADTPYKIGDYIVLDTGDRGEVTHVGLRSTRLKTRDDIEVTLPNAVIANAKIINESGGGTERSRLRIRVGVAYSTDVDHVVDVLMQISNDISDVCKVPEARVRMRGFGDSSMDFDLLCWIDHPADRGRVTHELYMETARRFAKEGIEIPFPQRDLWVRSPVDLASNEQEK